jgi:hypothetical protein
MRLKRIKKLVPLFGIFVLVSCSNSEKSDHSSEIESSEIDNVEQSSRVWPKKLASLPVGMEVRHNPAVVFATENTKDPEKWGTYQLQLTTSVVALEEDLEIIEFGGYLLEDDQWVFRSIYDRPFDKEEFIDWYNCPEGLLQKGVSYSDHDNWLAKTDNLSGQRIISLWYFIGKNKNGNKFVGASEVIGHVSMK